MALLSPLLFIVLIVTTLLEVLTGTCFMTTFFIRFKLGNFEEIIATVIHEVFITNTKIGGKFEDFRRNSKGLKFDFPNALPLSLEFFRRYFPKPLLREHFPYHSMSND